MRRSKTLDPVVGFYVGSGDFNGIPAALVAADGRRHSSFSILWTGRRVLIGVGPCFWKVLCVSEGAEISPGGRNRSVVVFLGLVRRDRRRSPECRPFRFISKARGS
jgi:hypothetical protein